MMSFWDAKAWFPLFPSCMHKVYAIFAKSIQMASYHIPRNPTSSAPSKYLHVSEFPVTAEGLNQEASGAVEKIGILYTYICNTP